MAFRNNIIASAVPYKLNKASYLKQGSRIKKSGAEDNLFDNCFEIKLKEHYEDNYKFRDEERARKYSEKLSISPIDINARRLRRSATHVKLNNGSKVSKP